MKTAFELQMKLIELGIIPTYPGCNSKGDQQNGVRTTLDKLDASSQRIVKRKYRKLWRKACRYMDTIDAEHSWHERCGVGMCTNEIQGHHRRYRLQAVLTFLNKNVQIS